MTFTTIMIIVYQLDALNGTQHLRRAIVTAIVNHNHVVTITLCLRNNTTYGTHIVIGRNNHADTPISERGADA